MIERAISEAQPRNYWPLSVPPLCLAMWWAILATMLGTHTASTVVTGAGCALAMLATLATVGELLEGLDVGR